MNTNENAAAVAVPPPATGSDLPFGTVFYQPRIRGPRSMMLTEGMAVTERGGHGGVHRPVMNREQWLAWLEGFQDELTGKEYREARAAGAAEHVEEKCWTDYRKRYAETGSPWFD